MTTKEIILKAIQDKHISETDLMMAPAGCFFISCKEDLDKLSETTLKNVLEYLRGLFVHPKF